METAKKEYLNKKTTKEVLMNRFTLLASSISLALALPALSVYAQEAPAEEAKEEQKLERIEVTGSRIKRTDMEGIAPVSVISTEDLETSGFDSFEELLQASIGNFGRTIEGNESSWTQGAHTINLRGMGANRTLVLVNGKRIPQYPTATGGSTTFVDISTFPSSAIERVEVLSGGASAIYGSDAIGGVVNIILKDSYEGSAIDLRTTATHEGGRERHRASFTTGIQSSLGQTMLVADFALDETLRYKDRDFTSRWGIDQAVLGSSTSLRFDDRQKFFHDTSKVRPTEEQCHDVLGEYAMWYPADVSSTQCRVDATSEKGLHSGKKEANLVMNHSAVLDSGWGINWLLQASHKVSERANGHKGISPDIFMDKNNPGNYSYDASDFDESVEFRLRRRMVDYGNRRDYRGSQYNYTQSLSLNKSFGDYDLDLTWSYGKATFFRRGTNQVLADKLLEIISFDPNDSNNPDKWYPLDKLTEEQQQHIYAETLTDAGSGLNQFMGVFSGDLFDYYAGTAQFALSGEWTKEWYFDEKDENTIAGNLLGQGGTQGRGERKRYAIAAEASIPLLNTLGGQTMEASIATRYDYYDDESSVGGAFTPQLGLMYRPNESLLLRANAGKSFRAPDMHRLYAGISRSFSSTNYYVDPNHPVDDSDRFESISAGNTDLKEEKGRFFNLGAVFQVGENFSGMLDFWHVSLRGAVYTESVDRILSDSYYNRTGEYTSCNDMTNLGFIMQQPEGQDYADILCVRRGTINSAYEASRGIDLELAYSWKTEDYGNFRLRTRASKTLKKEYQAFEDSPIYEETESDYLAKWKGDVSLRWSRSKWSSTLSYYYIGTAMGEDDWNVDGESVRLASKLGTFNRVNWTTSYRLAKQHRVNFAISNLFNRMPPEYIEGHPYRNSSPYFLRSQGYNVLGRMYTLSYRYTF